MLSYVMIYVNRDSQITQHQKRKSHWSLNFQRSTVQLPWESLHHYEIRKIRMLSNLDNHRTEASPYKDAVG